MNKELWLVVWLCDPESRRQNKTKHKHTPSRSPERGEQGKHDIEGDS